MRKPKAGETLFLVDVCNRARGEGGKQRYCIVSKVGRKYFYVKERVGSWYEIQFYIDTWTENSDYSSGYALYENRQAWKEEREASSYRTVFRETFDYSGGGKFTLNQLKEAAEILGISIEEGEK